MLIPLEKAHNCPVFILRIYSYCPPKATLLPNTELDCVLLKIEAKSQDGRKIEE